MVFVTDQLIHCYIKSISGNHEFACTFVYAYNTSAKRDTLRKELKGIAQKVD